MNKGKGRFPELPAELSEQLSKKLRACGEAMRSGDAATAGSLLAEAWELRPADKFGWDYYPQTISQVAVENGAAAGLCADLPIWLKRMYAACRDVERRDLMTLKREGRGWLGCGRDADARLAFQRAFDLYGKAGFRGEDARYLDWLNGAPLESEPIDETPTMPPEELERRIDELAEAGNVRLDEHDDWRGAIEIWKQGLAILPTSERYSESAMWFHASIGIAQRLGGQSEDELESFEMAYRSGDGFVNPFVLAGLGMSLSDNGRPDDAVDYLLRAYMLTGDELFEDEDAKYLDLLRAKNLI